MEFSRIINVETLDSWRVRIECRDGSVWERDLTDLVEGDTKWDVLAESDHF